MVNFDRTHLFDLVQPLQTIVQSNPKDKGSMQLLLLLTSKYAQAIIEFSCIDLIEEICQLSTMFLKRSVLGQLTSIKKKMLVWQNNKKKLRNNFYNDIWLFLLKYGDMFDVVRVKVGWCVIILVNGVILLNHYEHTQLSDKAI